MAISAPNASFGAGAWKEGRVTALQRLTDRVWLRWMLHRLPQPLIHRTKPARRMLRLLQTDPSFYKRYQRPDALGIVTAHNYPGRSLFEQSLDYLMEGDYVVLRHPLAGPWRNWVRLRWVLDFIESGDCSSEVLLFCDARDVVLKGDPQRVLEVFERKKCDLLFSSTDVATPSAEMPEVRRWADSIRPGRYLNFGVWVGRVPFVAEVLREALAVVECLERAEPDVDPARRGVWASQGDGPPFFRIGSDQGILRYLQPKFHPRIQVDYDNEMVHRKASKSAPRRALGRAVRSAHLQTSQDRLQK
jgi:hypothetical protein